LLTVADICPKQRDDQSAEQSTTAAGKVANLREVPPDRTREVPADPTNPALDDAKQKAALDPSSPKPHPRRLRRILLFLGPLLLAVAGLYFYLSSGRYVVGPEQPTTD
jgi:hypothetical protein